MDQFVKNYKLPKLNQDEIDTLKFYSHKEIDPGQRLWLQKGNAQDLSGDGHIQYIGCGDGHTNLRCAEPVELNTHTHANENRLNWENLKVVDCICVKSWSQYPVVLQDITVAEKNG